MTRDFQINGETLVLVKWGAHITSGVLWENTGSNLTELGLAVDSIHVMPRFVHADVHADAFGPLVPAEVRWQLAWADVHMTLVHYDRDALDVCVGESMGGFASGFAAGTLQPGGVPLGRGRAPLQSGCHYVSLNLTSPQLEYPWRFPTTYLAERPLDLPLGTKTSQTKLRWRAVPYVRPLFPPTSGDLNFLQAQEVRASGAVLWDHTLDT